MKALLTRRNFAVLLIAVIAVGMVYSRAAISIGMIGLLLMAIADKQLPKHLKAFAANKTYWVLAGLLALYLLSGLYTSAGNYGEWLGRVRTKLPFLALPLAFTALPAFNRKKLAVIGYCLMTVVTVAAIHSLVNYFSVDTSAVDAQYAKGKVIETPLNHIRFSLLVVLAIGYAGWMWYKQWWLAHKHERLLLAVLIAFLVIFLHILAARSGMLALYLVGLYLLGYIIINGRRYVLGGILLLALACMPLVVWYALPAMGVHSLKNKIVYMQKDLHRYFYGERWPDFSDSGRLSSIDVGLKTGMQQPLIGVGMGDVISEMQPIYERDHPYVYPQHRFIPHNQFVFYFAGMGFIGLLGGLLIFFYPWWANGGLRNIPLSALHIVTFTGLMVDPGFELQVGVASYVLLLMLMTGKQQFGVKTITE